VGGERPAWGLGRPLRRQVLAQYTRPIPQRQEGTFPPNLGRTFGPLR
jgi:hypothetical protein